jgi:cytoskeletal protein RodZ
MSSLGEELKSLREQRQLSIEEVAGKTRISKRYLEYIEQNRFDLLPGGAFSRAFVRTYSQALGMNPQEALARFSRSAPSIKAKIHSAEPALHRHRPLLRFLFSTITMLTLFVLFAMLLYREIISTRQQLEEAKAAATTLVDLPSIPTTTLPPQVSQEAADQRSAPVVETKPIAVGTQYALNLVIEVRSQCWISVNADGRQITSQLLARGDKLPFHANNQFSLILGNAGGVVLYLNGQQLREPGALHEVKKLVLSLDNYQEFLAEKPPQKP